MSYVQNNPRALTVGTSSTDNFAGVNAYGAAIVIDFWTQVALDGKVFQIKAGTITTPLVGQVPITDTAAELCLDTLAGQATMIAELGIAIRLGTGTLHEYALKSKAGSNSSAGTAFIPLPLFSGTKAGAAAAPVAGTTARVQATGNVTVPAETATTTLRHYEFSQPIAAGAYTADINWHPLTPVVMSGVHCAYLQMGAAGTGPSYYAHLNYGEFTPAQLGI